jgi:hypothetical protein
MPKLSNYEIFEKNKSKFSVVEKINLNTSKEKQDLLIKTFYNKSNKTIKDIHYDKNQLMRIREDFRKTFNNNKDSEAKIFKLLETDKEGNNLDEIIYMFKQILLNEKKSSAITKIHSLISKKKDEIVQNMLIKQCSKEDANKILNEIKLNKWNINSINLKKLIEIVQKEN